jgi:osmoprotectant transport system permease protein
VLEDPLGRFPPYDAIILLSPEAQKMPRLIETLKPLVNSITQDVMREANRLVDLEKKSPAEAARWLQENLRQIPLSID